MSLSGTLDTLSLPELLTVLAATRRSGELVVRGAGFEGRLWLTHGGLVKAEVPTASDMVGAVTALLAVGAGEFAFTADTAPFSGAESIPVEEVLSEAQSRRAEWLALAAAVPSLASKFRLTAEPTAQSVTVRADDWGVLVALSRGVDVRHAMDELDLSEMPVRRSVRALRDAGLLEPADEVDQRPAAPAVLPAPYPAAEPAPAAEPGPASSEETVSTAQPAIEPVIEAEHEPPSQPPGEDEPVSRSMLFRYLSGEHS